MVLGLPHRGTPRDSRGRIYNTTRALDRAPGRNGDAGEARNLLRSLRVAMIPPTSLSTRAPARPSGPSPLWRALFRIPLVLHGLGLRGLERVVGIDWVVLTTRGRRTGKPHPVVLDVVHHDVAGDVHYVQPAYGRASGWVRNVLAHPTAWAEVRGRAFAVRVDDVTGPEGADAVLQFIRRHPRYARLVVWFVGYVDSIDRSDDELRAQLATTPVFSLRPITGAVDSPAPRA